MSVKYLDSARKIAVLNRTGAVVTASSYLPENELGSSSSSQGPIMTTVGEYSGRGLSKVARWGKNNLKPNYWLQLLGESNINEQLIATKVNFALGRVYAFKWEEQEDGTHKKVKIDIDPQILRYMNSRKVRRVLRARATDFFIHGNVWAKMKLNRGRDAVADIEHIDAFRCRLEMKNKGKVNGHYICADWRYPRWTNEKKQYSENCNVIRWPSFDEERPLRYMISMLHSKFYWSGQEYYGKQPWQSGHNWINYSNKMPVWGAANINRAFNIKYHIKYPDSYFDYLEDEFDTVEEREAEKDRVFLHLDSILAGAENAQTTFFTSFEIDPMSGRSMASWEIEAVKSDLKDDAFIKAFEVSNSAMTSAQGVDPSLAGILLHGKMPPSGSEKRISYQLHEVLKTDEVREIMFEPWSIMRDVNGWDPDLQFGIQVRNIVTLAEAEGGIQQTNQFEDDGDDF
jgi:hypothetical protein